ncbi:Mn2+/Fe2+ NRAMP family transporter [Lachnotalea glycerini]|uniref:Metal ABC transporter n=1 Tax=Lachnotalea glycerini TaxID=1763509 RepID=A0A255IPM8_9FIRM|nr:Nramp family divalent metal transporter [Lachnotalea glycerini]PXV87754.1 Mn2+/Fe2+ NRAMP family transporter [Lachnotalea glycerini]RDY32079.1 metal ABC transporter [Lachnotalea glycerini]
MENSKTINSISTGQETFDPSKVKKLTFLQILKRIGPGIILTGVVIGPGNITTSAMLGADYGYRMIWLIIPIFFMGITFMLTTYRISMLTGMPILHAIRHYYGKAASGFVGVALFLACLFFTLGNVTGTGAGMNLIFGIDWKIGALVMLVILFYCYFSKGVYSKVEKGILVCILGMILAFYATLVASGGPDFGEIGKGLTHWTLPEGSLTAALAYISTNAAVTAGIYGTYLGAEKKWKKEDLFNGAMLADAIAHIITVILISGSIILVGAIVLHPQGISIKAPAQLGELLVPFLGNAAKYVMGVALLGAGFSSLLGNTQRGMVLLSAGFNKEVGLESKTIRWGCVVCLVAACAICFSYGGSPTQLIFLANVATAIATPVAGLFIVLMIWKSEVNDGMKPPRLLQICMTVSYLFALVMTASALSNYVPKLITSITSLF